MDASTFFEPPLLVTDQIFRSTHAATSDHLKSEMVSKKNGLSTTNKHKESPEFQNLLTDTPKLYIENLTKIASN